MSTLDAHVIEPAPSSGVLEKIWATPPGILGWLASVDHKSIGKRYLVTAFLFLAAGGIEALVMRAQLARPDQHVVTPDQYNQLFSMHGMTMIFLYALPVLSGFSNYLWPLLFGARDMAFPRLNAASYWMYVAAGLFTYAGFAMGAGANDGWFNYAPNSERDFNPGLNIDFYALGMIFLGVSTTVGAINFVVTFFRMRAPGMSIEKVPIMTWGTLTASAANILVIPAVSVAFFLLWLDRQYGTHFFDVAGGGQPLLWQHLFWMFGHPWVYAVVLPAIGMTSEGLQTLCRRPLVCFEAVALATVATMVLGFGVWVHHMFATGLPALALSFFSGASIIIAVPSALAVFAWIATIWTGRPIITTAFLYFASVIVLFVIGGVSGFMTASVPVDWQLTDTYFVVAHLHYVLIGINLFAVAGGIYHWFPKMTGRLLDERFGRWTFWTMFVGFNLAFLPMHVTGLLGMPRRVYTYASGFGWDTLNLVTSLGSLVFAAGVLMLVIAVLRGLRNGAPAGANPWDAPTLEWSVPSPPPTYNFLEIPIVASRYPLWERTIDHGAARSRLRTELRLEAGRETLATSALDADIDLVMKMPGDTLAPLVLTIGMALAFVGLLLHLAWLTIAAALVTLAALVAWLWPQRELAQIAGAPR